MDSPRTEQPPAYHLQVPAWSPPFQQVPVEEKKAQPDVQPAPLRMAPPSDAVKPGDPRVMMHLTVPIHPGVNRMDSMVESVASYTSGWFCCGRG
ncbi:hypothetical protein M427DRAFT_354224 [Gonapodya prolifera JEL478]|uniref:Uncharacterized protein n=1 Tax=Gonapodya prolifera (strain JEL478) TaxID=1344416 RepID=A0A139ABE3_GONPJ|nr:hypothetical protein M427DRAFT_354224 [Gonapodya prolifera JEL478]|eukprot:KXS14067.1 hypothetical protein M427DRAFT_354224 [Gonapodya prolifera JEL478]